jgi:hypothetical protein
MGDGRMLSNQTRDPSKTCTIITIVAIFIIFIIVLAFSLLAIIVGLKSAECSDGRIRAWLIFTGTIGLTLIPAVFIRVSM